MDIALALAGGSFISGTSSSTLLYFRIPTKQGRARLDALIKWNGILMIIGLMCFAISVPLKKHFMIFGHGITGCGAGFIVGAPDAVLLCDISKNDKSYAKKSAEFEMYNTIVMGAFFSVTHVAHYFTEDIGISFRISLYLTLSLILGTYTYTMYGWANDEDWIFHEGMENSIYSDSLKFGVSESSSDISIWDGTTNESMASIDNNECQ